MIALIEPAGGRVAAPLCQFRVVLTGTKPPIWRLLQVPGTAKLGWLHAVLQVAMGWTNSHLHQFRVNGALYSDTRHHYAEFEGDPEILDEWAFTLLQVVHRQKNSFGYDYDFGDSWRHQITIEKILPPDIIGAARAICLDGARACPPEDCGGIWGYANLLKILKNRRHPEHKARKAWFGRPFDAEAFDVAKANAWLCQLKWPRVTEGQLRKVLMGRDDYRE
jgi:hypothetical protein